MYVLHATGSHCGFQTPEVLVRYRLVVLLGAVVLSAGCANPERDKLERGMAHARRIFADVARNPISAGAFGSTLEGGGTLTGYIAASTQDNTNLPTFNDDRPSGPWSIALRMAADDRVIIEGFGETTDKPLRADTVSVRYARRPSTP